MIKIGLTDYTPENKIIDVRDKNQVIKAKYAIGKDDILKYTLMNEHYIEISFELNRNATFKRSDYIEWEGEKYTLREDYQPEQVNKRKYKYTLKFEAIEMFFQDIQYYYLNQGLKESEWRLTGNPEYFIKIAVDNVNRYFGTTDFIVGTIEPTEIKDITFEVNTNTFNALTQVADDYGAEWYITGKTIHLLNKVSFGDEVDFETEVSVLSMKREEGESTTRYTRILALGSTRNIPYDYRETTPNEAVDAVYPKRLRIPASKGDVIDAYPNMSPDEVVEGTVIFDEVYPRREGTIEAVGTIEYQDVNEDTGEVTKWNAYKIKDSGINFKKEYLLPGQELKLQFTSGDLNGRDFALIFHEKGFSSSDNSQFYEIVRTDEFGKLLPNDVMKPKAGDKYVLYGFNIALVSDQYVPAGELELYDVATAWQQKQLRDTGVYECPTVIKHFIDNQMDLAIGQKVRLIKDISNSRNYLLSTSNNRTIKGQNIVNQVSYGYAFANGNMIKAGLTEKSLTISFKYEATGENIGGNVQVQGSAPFPYFGRVNLSPTNSSGRFTNTFKVATNLGAATNVQIRTDNLPIGTTVVISEMKIEIGNKATDWSVAPEDVSDGIRSSRVMGFEKKLNNKFDAIYTVGDNSTYSRFGKIEQQIKELQVAGIVYESTGGNGVYVIKQFDTTRPTDFNVYSAIASDAKYFNKQTGGTVQGDTTFAKNMQVQGTAIGDVFQNSTFTAGQFGSGFQIKRDANGQSYMEVDNLLVRRETVFNRLTIAEIKSVGGTILLSLASMVLSKVEVKTSTWKCFFDTADGTIPNDYAVGDQAICRKFTGKDIKYYWALVTAVGVDYIELSKTDKDGSGIPAIGDEVVQLGNRTDVNRQYAIMLSAYGSAAPSINQYAGINSYDLTGKEVTAISPKGNKFTGSFIVSTNGTTAPVYKERGVFINGTVYYLNDRVSYLGSYWVCIVNTTITTPSEGSTTWRKDTAGQTDINNAISDIQVGGRNYLLSTSIGRSIKGQNIANQVTGGYNILNGNFANADLLDKNITLSFKYKVEGLESNSWLSCQGDAPFPHFGGFSLTPATSSGKHVYTRKVGADMGASTKINFRVDNLPIGATVTIYDAKLEIGDKATDWNVAPEDIAKQIKEAEDKATKAQEEADKANGVIADIANDNKLTPNEKQIIAKDWGDIQKEYPSAISEANKFGISTTAYTNAYNALNTYITPLLVDLTTTNDIVGSTFRLRFNTYRDEYVKLLNAIASKTKDLADAAQTSANNAQNTANQAKTDATNAQSAANKAQTDANTANNLLSDIASDNKLTPNEKQETKKEWDTILSEYPKNIAQANKFGVSTTAYTNAYNALNSYITPLLANLGTTSDINGATFRATFKAYYDARTDLLNAISTKAKDLADAAQTTANNAQKEAEKVRTEYKADFVILDTKIASKVSQTDFDALNNRVSTTESNIIQLSDSITSVVETVNNISIGGRNYLLNTSTKRTMIGQNIANQVSYGYAFVNGNMTKAGITDVTLTISCKYEATGDNISGLIAFQGSSPFPYFGRVTLSPTNSSGRFTNTFKVASNLGAATNLQISADNLPIGTTVVISEMKIEIGNKATDWNVAPEDTDAQIKQAQEKATQAQSAADQAKTDATNAQSAANKAQTDANTANNLLSDIASDNKLTPNEKQDTKKEWDIIVSEYPKNIAQANKFGVSRTAYTTAYDALNGYITPYLTNLDTTSNISSTTFNTRFKDYYDARTDLLNAISTKAKDLADTAQTSANNAQNTADSKNRTYYQDAIPTAPSGGHKVGDLWYKTSLVDSSGNINADSAKNIYQLQYRWDGTTWRQINWSVSRSKIEQTDSSISLIVEKTGINSVGAGTSLYSMILQTEDKIVLEVSKVQVGGRNYLLNTSTKRTIIGQDRTNQVTSGYKFVGGNIGNANLLEKDITLSFKYKVEGLDKNVWMSLQGDAPYPYFGGITLSPTNSEGKFTDTRKIGASMATSTQINIRVDNLPTYATVVITEMQIEVGNKATDWNVAPEDLQAGIDKAQNTADSKTTLDEVSSSLTITDNKITLASKTIELTGTTIAESIKAGRIEVGNLTIEEDGTLKAVNGEFSGVLKGVTGSFKRLQAIDDNGISRAEIGFSPSEGKLYFEGDMQHQGYDRDKQRSYRFLTSDLWCRGNFGAWSSNVLYIQGSYGYYYPKGLGQTGRVYVGFQSKVSSNNITYYEVPLYGTVGDASGFPVDMVIINTSSEYTYLLGGATGKQVTVINSNDRVSTYVFSMGNRVGLVGGAVRHFYNIDGFYSPSLASNIIGQGWVAGAVFDNTWS